MDTRQGKKRLVKAESADTLPGLSTPATTIWAEGPTPFRRHIAYPLPRRRSSSPPVGARRPATIRRRVDLPHPEGPTMVTNLSRCNLKVQRFQRRHAPGKDPG